RAAFEATAIADADAAERGAGEAALVVWVLEVRRGLRRIVLRADAKVLVDAISGDELSGVHASFGIPDRLELAECLHQLRAEHLRQQFGARLAVAVLTGQGAAVREHEV